MNLLRINKEVHPIYWFHKFLSDEEIQKIFDYVKDLPKEDAKIGGNIKEENKKLFTPRHHIKDFNLGNVPRTRIANLKWIELNSETNWIYKKIISKIHEVNQENFDLILKFVDIRKLSFTIQLTNEEEYEGGELIFYKNGEEKVAPKTKGTIIFFESDIFHEVKPIKKGTRHSLVSWVQGPNLR